LTIDMRTDAGVQRAFASPPTTSILLGTLRCVWSEKTTVCRIFNCQRSSGGKLPRITVGGLGISPPAPLRLGRSWGPKAPLRSSPPADVTLLASQSAAHRLPELLILRVSLARCKRDVRKTFFHCRRPPHSATDHPTAPTEGRGGAWSPRRAQMPEASAN